MRSSLRWWQVFRALFPVWKRGRRLPRSARARRRQARRSAGGRAITTLRRPLERLAIQPLESRLALTGVPELVKDINTFTVGSDPADIVSVGATVFFTATDAEAGAEIWKSDGTAAG
ncbi:MAG: hypothetical protein ACKO3G_09425, partial [Planctomycetaceae bacterium]